MPGGFTSEFFGTIFAPFGNVTVDLQDMHGSILGKGVVSAEVYLDHRASDYLRSPRIPEVLVGDVDLNGAVNFLDISPFITVLLMGGDQAEADCDKSGAVDFRDISPFIGLLNPAQEE